MTGPAEGKLGLNADVYLILDGKKVKLRDPFVCIHLKGYSLARVTHLDIEHDVLDELIPPKRGRLHSIKGIKEGIEIELGGNKEIEYHEQELRPKSVLIKCPTLNEVLRQGQRTRTWVGGKFGGIYIGFRKPEIRKMEKIARERFGIFPK